MVSRMKVGGETAVENWRAILNGKVACKYICATRCAAHLDRIVSIFMDLHVCLHVSCEIKGVEECKD